MIASSQSTLALVDTIFRWIRIYGTHGAEHPLAAESSRDVIAAVHAATPPVALQFVLGAVFREGKLIPMDVEQYRRSEHVARALRNAGVQELAFTGELPSGEARDLARALARGAQGPTSEFDDLQLSSVRWRSIPTAKRGAAFETVDADTAATVGVALAVAAAEQLPPEGADWPWDVGVDAVRRLERAFAARATAVLRVVESAPGAWSVARRSVSAATHVLAVLRALGSETATQRAAAHATLLLATRGLGVRAGRPVDEVAAEVCVHLFATDRGQRFEPHHLRIATICHALAAGSPAENKQLAVMPLVALAYDLERRRVSARGEELSRIELLALAITDRRYSEQWTRVLVNAMGIVPPGATVALPDGRIGVVVGPGRAPFQPEVLVDGNIVRPVADVKLVSRQGRDS